MEDSLDNFCRRHGIHGPLLRERIGAGRNSRVMRLRNAQGQWILKDYGPVGARGHDRLGTEFAFLQYLQAAGVANAASPIGMDRTLHSALYSALPGERPSHIESGHLVQAAQFVADLNRDRMTPQARALTGAADACRTWQDHLTLVCVRLTQLLAVTPHGAAEERARELVAGRFLPQWQFLAGRLTHHAAAQQTIVQILSPSDFGFHNALLYQGRLAFVDFEYAGWDDPVKLICDFLCQPELAITREQGEHFIAELVRGLPHIGGIEERVDLLLPLHRLKWCCILLNEFRPECRERRLRAGVAAEGLLAAQLDKAIRYFDTHCAGQQPGDSRIGLN